jgi:hypothetical protein
MQIGNLLLAANFVEKIPQEKFHMGMWRTDLDDQDISCNTIGCAIGHLTALFPEHIMYSQSNGEILFATFADNAFEIENDSAFMWCFAAEWAGIDDTPTGCAYRIRYLVDEGEKAAEEKWIQTRKEYQIK